MYASFSGLIGSESSSPFTFSSYLSASLSTFLSLDSSEFFIFLMSVYISLFRSFWSSSDSFVAESLASFWSSKDSPRSPVSSTPLAVSSPSAAVVSSSAKSPLAPRNGKGASVRSSRASTKMINCCPSQSFMQKTI